MLRCSFKAALRYTPPSPDLLVSGVNPKLWLGRRRSGVVPSVEAPSGDTGLVVEFWQWLAGSL
jgi:hypothetical protein